MKYQLHVFNGPSVYAVRPVMRARISHDGPHSLSADLVVDRLNTLLSSNKFFDKSIIKFRINLGNRINVHWADVFGVLSIVLQDNRFEEQVKYWMADLGAENERCVLVETNDAVWGQLTAQFAAFVTHIIFAESWETERANNAEQLSQIVAALIESGNSIRLNNNTRLLVEAARRRDIPVLPLVPNRGIMILGQGHKQQRLMQCLGDSTSALAALEIARDKTVTSRVLHDVAIPVPRQFVVRSDADLARAVAEIGFPLVVKGATGAHGDTVTAGVQSEDELRHAINKVRRSRMSIVIEQYIEGDDYRMTVINGRLVAAARRTPAHVIGDGERTVAELIELENKRRVSSDFAFALPRIAVDDDTLSMLKRQGLTGDSVPEPDQFVVLRSAANIAQGGLPEDVTDQVHPDVVVVAERAARAVGLDMAGVDIKTDDITRPLSETNGAVLEVNNFPGLRPHYLTPTPPRDVAGRIVEYLFPDGDCGRIPTVAVTGTNGKTTTCRMLRRIFEAAGYVVGMSTTNEMVINGQTILREDCAGGRYASMIVKDPTVEAGIFEMARGGLIRGGFRLDGCTVGVVTNVTNDHVGLEGCETVEDLARVKRLVVELARNGAVLNADNPLCVDMAPHVSAPIWWFSEDPDSPVIRDHLKRGGNAVLVGHHNGRETLLRCGNDEEVEIVATADIPATLGGAVRVNIANAAAAASAALAAAVPISFIRSALRSFSTDFADSPGRLNIYEQNGITIVVDFAHNEDSLSKLISFIGTMRHAGNKRCFFSMTNSRTPDYYKRVTAILAQGFDQFVVSDETIPSQRRSETEVVDWLRDGLLEAGVDSESIEATKDLQKGRRLALEMAKPGDLVFIKTGLDVSGVRNDIVRYGCKEKTMKFRR